MDPKTDPQKKRLKQSRQFIQWVMSGSIFVTLINFIVWNSDFFGTKSVIVADERNNKVYDVTVFVAVRSVAWWISLFSRTVIS